MIEATCHCGAVRITLAEPLVRLTDCNCSLCRRVGALWSYHHPAQVEVHGETVAYVQGDRKLEMRHCAACGCVTHWEPVRKEGAERMGVNARLIDPHLMEGVPIRRLDGADTWTYLD